MVYDNLKTVLDTIFVGKERRFNRRFSTLANHYLFEPVACTPKSGWEKGQVENQVGNISEWLFTPTPKFADCFGEEQPLLMPVNAMFDGYVESMRRVSSLCLIRIDRNRYSVVPCYSI